MPDLIQISDNTPSLQTGFQTKAPGHVPRGATPDLREQVPPGLMVIMDWLMRVALVLFIGALVYFAYALFYPVSENGHSAVWWYGSYQTHLSPASAVYRAKTFSNLHSAGSLLAVTGVYLAIYAFIVAYEHGGRFIPLALAFAAFNFGTAMLFATLGIDPTRNNAAAEMFFDLRIVGDACLVVVLFKAVCSIVDLMKNGVSQFRKGLSAQTKMRPDGRAASHKPAYRLVRKCWETGYCQEALLRVCGAWQRKVTCWKHGSGCLCDPTMTERLFQLDMGEAAGILNAVNPGAAKAPSVSRAWVPTGPQKCHRCPIFVSHQEEKFNVINPMVPVAVIGLVVLFWDVVVTYYQGFANWFGGVIGHIALGPTQQLAQEWTETMLNPFVQYALLACGIVIATSYLLKMVEWLILKKML